LSAHVSCGQMAGWIKMLLGTEVNRRPRRHCVRWGPRSPKKGDIASTNWPMYCGQTVALINMPLGTGVGLGPGHTVLHGDPPTP